MGKSFEQYKVVVFHDEGREVEFKLDTFNGIVEIHENLDDDGASVVTITTAEFMAAALDLMQMEQTSTIQPLPFADSSLLQ